MLQKLLLQEEGKTLEFKENTSSLLGLIKAVVAFANTAGGTIVIGVEDKTKKVVGLTDPLVDEERIISKIADLVSPLFIPNIEIQTYRKKAVIIIQVPYVVGPHYLKKGSEKIAYIRFGSTNRVADEQTISTLKLLSKNITFDESPCHQAQRNGIDWQSVKDSFASVHKHITRNKAKNIGIVTTQGGEDHPSNGGILLFGKDRLQCFPDAIIRCVRFSGLTRENSLDHIDIDKHLPIAIDEVLYFIKKNTFTKTKIGQKMRADIQQYPPVAVREAVINSIVHTDYSIKGSSIIVAIFDDRMEITNPGAMPYGLSLQEALAGSSRARNRVIAKTFHLMNLVEQWGSGLEKIIQSCLQHGLEAPKFEEIGSQFRVTFYSAKAQEIALEEWQKIFLQHLHNEGEMSARDIAKFWDIDVRSARRRLKKLYDEGMIAKTSTLRNDPKNKYIALKGFLNKRVV